MVIPTEQRRQRWRGCVGVAVDGWHFVGVSRYKESQWAGLVVRRDESTDEDKADTGTHTS